MNMRVIFAAAIWVAASGCAGARPSPLASGPDVDEAIGEPVYQPMLIVPLPQLDADPVGGRPIEAMTARSSRVGDVVFALFKDAEVNVIVDEDIQQRTCTFDIKHATLEEAFESLLKSLDLACQWDGSFLRIGKSMRETLYVDLMNSADGGGGGTGESGASGQAQGGSNFWSDFEAFLPQVLGEGKAIVNRTANTIHVDASPTAVARLRELVDTTLARRNAQVSIEARILEVRLDDQHNLGVNWGLLPGILNTGHTGLGAGGAVVSQTATSGSTTFNFGLLDDNQYSVFVDALEKQGQVRVLSSPRVSTMNNVAANIRVADQIPVISREVITDQGVARSEFSVTFIEAGVIVNATPVIGTDGMITIRVAPEVTEQTGTVVTPDGLITQPVLSRRTAQTVVRVADGQAVVIGGLRKTRKDETLQGVPFLMDLPFLGQVFSSTVQTRQEVELMILVVPRVLDAAWIQEETRRGAHRLETLRRPMRWNSIGIDSHRSEDWSGGSLQGAPIAATEPAARVAVSARPPAAVESRPTITRAGLAARLLVRAQTAIDNGQPTQAIAWLEQALELEAQNVRALVTAGVLLQRQGQPGRARMLLERALQAAPADTAARTAMAVLDLTHGSPHRARSLFAAVHEQAPSGTSATNLAAATLLCDDAAMAKALLQAAVVEDSPPELFANLCYAQLATGDVDAAAASLQHALTRGADARNPRIVALQQLVLRAR